MQVDSSEVVCSDNDRENEVTRSVPSWVLGVAAFLACNMLAVSI